MLQKVDRHLNKCTDARRRGEWNIVLTEVTTAMTFGADVSPQVKNKHSCMLTLVKNQNQTFLSNFYTSQICS